MTRPAFLGTGLPTPIDLPGGAPRLLLFHGFGSTPRELDPVAELAQELKLAVSAPLFPGHGTTPDDLAKTRFTDWYQHGEREFLRLKAQGPLIVGGLSTGALVAMKLAALYPQDVRGLIVLANALRLLAPYPAWPLWALNRLHVPDFALPKSKGPDIADPKARAAHLTYSAQPMRAAADLQSTGKTILPLLPRVRCPTFIAHGQDDHVCPVSNAWLVADAVGTNDVEVVILPRSWHIVTKDLDAAELSARLRLFLRRLLQHQ
jgi:carboxylesterase